MKLDIGRRFRNLCKFSILSMLFVFFSVESFAEISDSVCVGQKWGDDERVILFVKMVGERPLSDQLVDRLKLAIRQQLSARHVPAVIMQIADIPVRYHASSSWVRPGVPTRTLCGPFPKLTKPVYDRKSDLWPS